MNLKHLSDKQLLLETKKLAEIERETMTAILHHLKEIEERKLFSDLKYSSIFEYAVHELGYSEPNAGRRIQGARLLRELPEIEEKIQCGSLTLTNINQAVCFFKKEHIEITDEKRKILLQLENKSKREADRILFDMGPPKRIPDDVIRPVSSDMTQLRICVYQKTLDKLNEARELIAHHRIDDEFFFKISEYAIKEILFKKFKVRETIQDPDSRYLTNTTKRTVYSESEGKCENCGSIFDLEYHHVESFCLGGKSEPQNLKLLCFNCNQREWIKICNPDQS